MRPLDLAWIPILRFPSILMFLSSSSEPHKWVSVHSVEVWEWDGITAASFKKIKYGSRLPTHRSVESLSDCNCHQSIRNFLTTSGSTLQSTRRDSPENISVLGDFRLSGNSTSFMAVYCLLCSSAVSVRVPERSIVAAGMVLRIVGREGPK